MGPFQPEVYFRIVHLAQVGHNGAPVAAYREQAIEIALGPKGAFENGNIGSLKLRAPPSRVVNTVGPARRNPKPAREPIAGRRDQLREFHKFLLQGTKRW